MVTAYTLAEKQPVELVRGLVPCTFRVEVEDGDVDVYVTITGADGRTETVMCVGPRSRAPAGQTVWHFRAERGSAVCPTGMARIRVTLPC